MNQKDLIKYGLMALGAYLIYRYIQDHGGLDGLFGTVAAGTHPSIAPGAHVGSGATGAAAPGSTAPAGGQPTYTAQPVPVLDVSGLIVVNDVNDSLTGSVKINGVPITLSVIPADGRIFDGSGSEVTGSLQSRGIDIVALRNAFQSAPVGGVSVNSSPEIAGLGWTPPWMM